MSIVKNTNQLFIECSRHNPDIQIIQQLIDIGISPLQSKNGYTLLMTYLVHSRSPDPQIITILVKAGVKIQARNKNDNNYTAISYAGLNNYCTLEVFKTLLKLGAHIDDINTRRFSYHENREKQSGEISDSERGKINTYFLDLRKNRNVDNTKVNNVYLHRALESYIIYSDHPDPFKISKIIQSYSHIPGIYPNSDDLSGTKTKLLITKGVSESLFQTLKVFYLAAAKRCSIEVFQTLIFDYGIEMAERFGSNLFDILAGNYCLIDDPHHSRYDFEYYVTKYQKSTKNILSSYIESYYTSSNMSIESNYGVFDFGEDHDHHKNIFNFPDRPFDLRTFKYLVSMLNLNFGRVPQTRRNGNLEYFPFHPLIKISYVDTLNTNPDIYLDIINILLNSDMTIDNINATDDKGYNVLMNYIENWYPDHKSSQEIDVRVITSLIKAGIDINYKNKLNNDKTVLMFVVYKRLPFTIFKTLIEAGADIYQVDVENSSLLSYSLNMHSDTIDFRNMSEESVKIFKYLISLIDFTKEQNNIDYYFHRYCQKLGHNLDVMDTLLSYGPDLHTVDQFGYDCLVNYIRHSGKPDPEIITRLIESGVDMNYKNKKDNGRTHLYYAIFYLSSSDIIKCLVNHGASFDNGRKYSNMFIELCDTGKRQHVGTNQGPELLVDINEKFKYLSSFLCSNPNVKKQNRKRKFDKRLNNIDTSTNTTTGTTSIDKIYIIGTELLHYCGVLYPNIEMINTLLQLKDIDVNRTDVYGYNALMVLVNQKEHYLWKLTSEMVIVLIKANIDLNYKNKRDKNHSILYYVCQNNQPIEIYKTLIEHGADPTIVGKDDTKVISKYLKKFN